MPNYINFLVSPRTNGSTRIVIVIELDEEGNEIGQPFYEVWSSDGKTKLAGPFTSYKLAKDEAERIHSLRQLPPQLPPPTI